MSYFDKEDNSTDLSSQAGVHYYKKTIAQVCLYKEGPEVHHYNLV